jgi:hypothetical protein
MEQRIHSYLRGTSELRILHLTASQAAITGNPIKSMRAGILDGILLTDVFSRGECQAIRQQLEENIHGMIKSDFPDVMRSFFLGLNLNLAEDYFSTYWSEASRFNRQVEDLLSGIGGLQMRILKVLSSLYGGIRFTAPPGPTGDTEHMITTFRCHLEGGFIPAHFDNEQDRRSSYNFLNTQIRGDLFSFVLVFGAPLGGGQLQIFDCRRGSRMFHMNGGAEDAQHIDLTGMASQSFSLQPGCMLIFNSGQLLHRLNPIEGSTPRWTACSFMSESKDGSCVYLWG